MPKIHGEYRRRLDATIQTLKTSCPAAALLLQDVSRFAAKSAALTVKAAGNKHFEQFSSSNKYEHAAANALKAAKENKRGVASTLMGTAASTGAGMGAASLLGGGALVGVGIAGAALTGGIAIGVIAVGIGIVVLTNIVMKELKGRANERRKGGDGADASYGSSEAIEDLAFLLKSGGLENLARFLDKAMETEQTLKLQLDGGLTNCGDAALLGHAMFRHKQRVEEKLNKSQEMDQIAELTVILSNTIARTDTVLREYGEIHTASIILHLQGTGHNSEQAKAFGKTAEDAINVRNYSGLFWKQWYNNLTTGASSGAAYMADLGPRIAAGSRSMNKTQQAAARTAFAFILKEGKNASDGDHGDICGKIETAMNEVDRSAVALATRKEQELGITGVGGGNVGGTSTSDFTIGQLQGVVKTALSTAAGSASMSSAFGTGAIGSMGNIAGSAGIGLAAGVIVSALVGYALERINDKNNIKAIFGNTVTDPVRRVWLLRSMLKAGRVDTVADSVRKCNESIAALQSIYPGGSNRIRKHNGLTTHADIVDATKHLFRLQKHMLRMFAMQCIVDMFWTELDNQVNRLVTEYSEPRGLADRVIARVVRQVESPIHTCTGTCYRQIKSYNGMLFIAHRLESVPPAS